MNNTVTRIVKSPVQVYRNGRFEFPPVGEQFEFTRAEYDSIIKANPSALGRIVVADEPKGEAVKSK